VKKTDVQVKIEQAYAGAKNDPLPDATVPEAVVVAITNASSEGARLTIDSLDEPAPAAQRGEGGVGGSGGSSRAAVDLTAQRVVPGLGREIDQSGPEFPVVPGLQRRPHPPLQVRPLSVRQHPLTPRGERAAKRARR